MNLVRAGKRVLNLCHMIDAEDDAPAPGELRLHVLPGREIILTGQDAAEFRLALHQAAPPVLVQISVSGRPSR